MTDTSLDPRIVDFVQQRSASDEYAAYCRNLLAELLEIDTTVGVDLARLAANETRTFDVLESELRSLLTDGQSIARKRIDPAIAQDARYSNPYYASSDGRRAPAAEEVYANRSNLVVEIEGESGKRGSIHNTHIDTVGPHLTPTVQGERVSGRGACDAKGQVVLMMAQIKLLGELRQQLGVSLGRRTYQFVIDEETGGNGTLALLTAGGLDRADAVVYEATKGRVHPAGRGAVWYHCRLGAGASGGNPLEIMPFVVHAMEKAGREIRAESVHPLFDAVQVQTNHGVLGPYGSRASAVNDHVAFRIMIKASANPERIQMRLVEVLDVVLADYCRRYGDKTRELDNTTGQPVLNRHYDLRYEPKEEGLCYRLEFFGRGGHMGALHECDGAITKAAHVLRALMMVARNYPKITASGTLADEEAGSDGLILEGGQGFLPTHSLDQVVERLSAAAHAGLVEYGEVRQVAVEPSMVQMSFDRLHNDAFASATDAPVVKAFESAHTALGIAWPELTGWGASCDARLFASFGHNVVTFGPGSITQAHGPAESIDVRRIQRALAISSLATVSLA